MILPLLALSIAAPGIVMGTPALQQAGASRTALVTVADGRNRPIVDLGPDDFVISEAGQTREILHVRPADYPVIVLVDTGAGARNDFEDIQRAVARFIGRLGQRQVAVGTLGDPPAMISSLDDDRQRVLEGLERLSMNHAANSVALESAARAARAFGQTAAAFSAIVVVSASGLDSSRRPADELTGSIIDSGAIVHVVANRRSPESPDTTAAADIQGQLERTLRALTNQTHGQFTTIYSAGSYSAALDRLSDRLANELLIEYLVPTGSKASDIRVGARIPGARVRGLGVRPRE